MQVLKDEDQWFVAGPGIQKTAQRMQHHLTAVARLAAYAGIPDRHGTALRQRLETGQPGLPQRVVIPRDLRARHGGQVVRDHLALVASQHRFADAQDGVVQLLPGDGNGIVIRDVALLLQHLQQRPVRQPFAVGGTAAAQDMGRRVVMRKALQKLLHQPGFADAGRGDHRDQVRVPALHHAAIQCLQKLHLLVAADHLRLEPPRGGLVGEADDAEPGPRPKLRAFHQRQHLVGDGVARGLACAFVHHDPVWGGLGLQARGEVDDLAGDHELSGRGRQQVGDDFARGDGDAEVQVGLQIRVQADHPALHGQGRPQRPLRVVLVRRRHPEDSHHRIADEFFDRPAIPGDLLAHRRKEAGDQRAHRLGIQLLGQPGRAYEVGEQHGDDTAFSRAGSLQESPALHAKLRLRRVAGAALWAARG